MAASHQRTPTFSFSNDAPGIDEDDLLRAQRLLGGGSHGDYYRQPWDMEPGLLRRPSYMPAPTMARYREEMMEMVRQSSKTGQQDGDVHEPVVCYELSLRDLVELPSAARALREGAAGQQLHGGSTRQVLQVSEKRHPPAATAPAEEMVTANAAEAKATKKKEKKGGSKLGGGRKRDVFRGQQALESGVFMLKFLFVPPGVFGRSSSSEGQQQRKTKEAAARSKVTPAPKAIWCDDDKCDRSVDGEAWEDDCDQAGGKASRSSSGGGSEASSSGTSTPRRRRRRSRRFSSCYSFLHSARRNDD